MQKPIIKNLTDGNLRDISHTSAADMQDALRDTKSILKPVSLTHISVYNKTTKSIEQWPISGTKEC